MEEIIKITNRKPPQILYHYTSFDALIKIIESKSLWATNFHYLNDSQEYKLATAITRDSINRRLKASPVELRPLLEEMLKVVDPHSKINICVFSLTENKDLLSQWRGYCPSAVGCAIGFDTIKLKELCKKNWFNLVQCIYSESEQIRAVNTLIDDTINKFHDNLKNFDSSDVWSYFSLWFRILGPMIKHSSFKEEAEWRMVSSAKDCTDPSYKFRAGKSTIIPYYIFSLGERTNELPIREVVVGPNPNQELATNPISSLFSKYGISKWEISTSKIPFREC